MHKDFMKKIGMKKNTEKKKNTFGDKVAKVISVL